MGDGGELECVLTHPSKLETFRCTIYVDWFVCVWLMFGFFVCFYFLLTEYRFTVTFAEFIVMAVLIRLIVFVYNKYLSYCKCIYIKD